VLQFLSTSEPRDESTDNATPGPAIFHVYSPTMMKQFSWTTRCFANSSLLHSTRPYLCRSRRVATREHFIHDVVLTGERKPRSGHREMKCAVLRRAFPSRQ
jgi:hypothetical protein